MSEPTSTTKNGPSGPVPRPEEREIIRHESGRVLAEIVRADEGYEVWRKDKPRFPPRPRNTLLATCHDIDEARKMAKQLSE